MAMITELNCNLREAVHVKYLDGNLFSQDVYGNAIRVIVMDGDEPATLAGTVSGTAIREDGSTVALTDSRIDENVATVVLPAAAYAVPGVIAITIKISDTNTVTTLAYVVANVYRTSTDTVVDPGTILPSITSLIEQIAEAVASIPADYSSLWAALAETFNASKSGGYAVGEYVTYDGGLYRFKNAHTGSWSSSDVDAVNLGSGIAKNASDISDLKSAFDSISEQTRNLWKWGDVDNVTGSAFAVNLTDGVAIPAGTYMLSAEITRTSSGNCRMVFYKDSEAYYSGTVLANPYLPSDDRNSTAFTLSDSASIIVVYSGPSSSSTATASWKNIQIESGSAATPYIKPITATDLVARESIGNLETEVETIETDIDNKWGNVTEAIGTHPEYEPITIPTGSEYGDGKYWNSENTSATIASSSNYYASAPLEVAEGELYKLAILQASSSKQDPALVVDENYVIKQRYKSSTTGAKNFNIEIGNGGKYLLLTTTKSEKASMVLQKGIPTLNEIDATNAGYKFAGKTVAIIGDSISTNGDYSPSNLNGNVPEIYITNDDIGVSLSAYVTFWDVWNNSGKTSATNKSLVIDGTRRLLTDSDIGTEITFVPEAQDVGEVVGKPLSYNDASAVVWWENAMAELGFNPVAVCWSGSSLSSHEGSKEMYKASYAWHTATIRKCGIRTPGTMTRTAPDIIIVYRGTNDFSHEPYATIDDTKINAYPGTYPTGDHTSGTYYYGFVEAMQLTVKKIREVYPDAMIVFCTLNVFKRVNYSEYPTNNGTNTLQQYNQTIRETAEALGCYVIDFDKDGITFENCYISGYITDSSDHPTHPSDKGHKVMGNRAILDLKKLNSLV